MNENEEIQGMVLTRILFHKIEKNWISEANSITIVIIWNIYSSVIFSSAILIGDCDMNSVFRSVKKTKHKKKTIGIKQYENITFEALYQFIHKLALKVCSMINKK